MLNESAFAFQDELESGERIVWSGWPKQGVIFRSYDKFIGIFIFLGLGVLMAWVYGILSQDGPLFALILIAFGFVQVIVGGIGPFIKDSRIRKNTAYALTNKRVVVVSNSPTRQVRSLNLQAISDMSFIQIKGSIGTILFGPAPSNAPWIIHTNLHALHQNMPLNFDAIEDGSMVYELIRKTQQSLLIS